MSGKQLYFSKQTQRLTYAGGGRSAGSCAAHREGGAPAVLLLSGEVWLRGVCRALGW